jgi:hypothetical protein
MKNIIPVLAFFCFTNGIARAQAPFNTMDSLDINNITPLVLVHGDMWWNPGLGIASCEFPGRSHKHIQFASSLWMSGYDGGNNLHIAAQTYRKDGNDYWPGPLDAADTLTYATSQNWAKIWKINKTTIDSFRALRLHTISTTPASILTWPGKGNSYATGNAGVPLTITTDMAPFADINGNGIYEPLLGEYPAVPGDQALWWLFSDNGPTHSETKGRPLGVEVHAMSYGYKRGTLIDNVVYYEYTMVNKSLSNYHNTRLALWDDGDLGWAYDDFIGFDSVWRLGIFYNGINDDAGGGGHPTNSYGRHTPVVGITMIVLPGDAGGSYTPAGSFVYYHNDGSIIGNPTVDTEYNNYMRAKLRNGQHLTNDFGGHGVPSTGYGSGPNSNYVFTGDPGDTSQWSQCNTFSTPNDQKFILSSNDFNLNAGTSQKVVFALIATDTSAGGGCPEITFDSIKVVADTAWGVYHATAVNNVIKSSSPGIYPNPAHDKITIKSGSAGVEETVIIYNTLGQIVNVTLNRQGKKYEADVSLLPAGLYYVLCRDEHGQVIGKFLKE